MFRIAMTLAAAGLWAMPLAAQEAASEAPAETQEEPAPVLTAGMLEDARILSLEGNYDPAMWENTAPLAAMIADLTEIGDVEEIVLTNEGQITGLTTDIGGFLGIGQKTVLIPLDDIRLVRSALDGDDDVTIVTRLNQEALEGLEEIEIDD